MALGRLTDRRGCVQLLVGSPGEDWTGATDAGIVHVIEFTPDPHGGRPSLGAEIVDQGDAGGSVEDGDAFGSAVVVGPDDDSVEDSIAVGAPGEDAGSVADVGAVNVIDWAGRRIYDDATEELRQGRDGIPGIPEAGDRFGSALLLTWAALPGDHEDRPRYFRQATYVIGAPGDTVAGARAAGSVTLAAAVDSSVTGVRDVVILTQDSPTVPGAAEPGDRFGAALATVDRLLAVGSPGEAVGDRAGAGTAAVVDLTDDGAKGRIGITQDTPGLSGTAESGDAFGAALAFHPSDPPVLAVGSPGEDLGRRKDAGLAHLLGVSPDPTQRELFSVRSVSLGVASRPGDRFGSSAAGLDGVREEAIAVSAPRSSGGLIVLYPMRGGDVVGPTRTWQSGRGGIPAVTRFGWSLG